MNSVTFKFWVTLEYLRRHGNLKPNVLIFVSNTSQLIGLVHFIINDWNYLELFGLLEEIGIKSNVLKGRKTEIKPKQKRRIMYRNIFQCRTAVIELTLDCT